MSAIIVRKWRAAGLVMTGALMLAPFALAQSPEAQTSAPEAQLPADAVADKKIDQFADAYIAVQEIQSQATQQLGSTTDAQKAQEVKQNAETQMIKAVERSGLQVEEFNQIVQAMAVDASLRDKVSGRIGERKSTT